MLKFLSKVRIEFNPLDPRTASCMEFLAQCTARKAKESNPACQLEVFRRPSPSKEEEVAPPPPQITVTFVNGVVDVIDAATPAQEIRRTILERGQMLETEQMFSEAGEKWPVVIPKEEIHQSFPGTKETNEGFPKLIKLDCRSGEFKSDLNEPKKAAEKNSVINSLT